jgi:acetate kinase
MIYLLRSEQRSADNLEKLLNYESGIFALSGGESSVKELEAKARSGDAQAAAALEAFVLSVRKEIGAYAALMGGVDLLVLTGGIGEHSEYVRAGVTKGLDFLGITTERVKVVAAVAGGQVRTVGALELCPILCPL